MAPGRDLAGGRSRATLGTFPKVTYLLPETYVWMKQTKILILTFSLFPKATGRCAEQLQAFLACALICPQPSQDSDRLSVIKLEVEGCVSYLILRVKSPLLRKPFVLRPLCPFTVASEFFWGVFLFVLFCFET